MMDYLTIILGMIVGVLAIYIFFVWENNFKRLGIPYKKPVIILGNMADVVFRRCAVVEHISNLYNFNRDAKYIGISDFSYPIIMIRDLELIKRISIVNFDHFRNRRTFTDPVQEPLFANNLFFLHDNEWRAIRKILSPTFTSQKLKAMFKLISEYAATFSKSLELQCVNESVEYNSKDIFSRFSNDTIATCAFGISVNSIKDPNNKFYMFGRRALNFNGIKSLKLFAARSFPTLSKILGLKIIDAEVDNFFFESTRQTIAMRDETGINRPDMIQLMMEARDNKKDSKTPELTIEYITAQIFIFFFGGFETISTLMCFAAHQLAISPEIQKKLQMEIDQVMASCDGLPTYEAVNNMKYLDAVINETLRMYPTAFLIDRECTKSFELPPSLPGGRPVMLKPGDHVWIGVWPIHRYPKYYPHPDEFDPERFCDDNKPAFNFNAYMPFGSGPRMCSGTRFALLNAKILFIYLLAKFNITPGNKMILPLQLSKKTFLVLAKGGFWIKLNPREISN